MANHWINTRRNHAVEHATIALLMQEHQFDRPVAGYSIANGFWIIGDLSTNEVEESTQKAVQRIIGGDHGLAISPFCGTNIVVSAAFAVIGTLTGYHTAGRGINGLSRALSSTVLATVIARPVGRLIQKRYTTSVDIASIAIGRVKRHQVGSIPIHWIPTSYA